MWITEHPSDDELRAYVTNRLYPPKSVKLARHLLACGECMTAASDIEERLDRAVQSATRETVWARASHALHDMWLQPSAGLATGFATVILVAGIGNSLRPSAPALPPPLAAEARPVFAPPAPQPIVVAESGDTSPAKTLRKTRRIARTRRPVRHFVPPSESRKAIEVGVLTPPPAGPVPSPLNGFSVRLAKLSTEVGPEPTFPAKRKRHALVRFFAVFAKPFRSSRS